MTDIGVFDGAESNGINFISVNSAHVFEILARLDQVFFSRLGLVRFCYIKLSFGHVKLDFIRLG